MAVYSSLACLPTIVPISSSVGRKKIKLSPRNVLEFNNNPKIGGGTRVAINGSQEVGHLFRGTLDKSAAVFTKKFLITSYQIDYDSRASMRAIMNILQDTIVDHYRTAGLSVDGFGITKEMSKRDLIWVFHRMHIMVHPYPLWDDIVEIQSFASLAPGKNTVLVEWLVRSYATGQIMIRANCNKLMVNKKTRKIQKIIDEVKEELKPNLEYNHKPIINEDIKIKLPPFDVDLALNVQSGLRAEWGDLDLNKHVNNAKYIEWILKSVPCTIMERHELSEFIIDFKKECGIDSVVQSSTKYVNDHVDVKGSVFQMDHSIRLENGSLVALARTTWTPKR